MNLSILVSVIPLSLLFAIPILIGVYVYKDAVQRGMNGALWALVVILTPGFIGLIIYLLVRNGYSRLQCPNCGTKVTEEYTLCPKCGTTLKAYCPSCRFPVERDWTVCPKCAQSLSGYQTSYTPPVENKDNSLGKILLIVIITPVLLFTTLILFSVNYNRSSVRVGYTNTAYLNESHYAERPEVLEWIEQCKKDPSKIYALYYEAPDGDQTLTTYLIYRPFNDQYTGVQTKTVEKLFGRKKVTVDFNQNLSHFRYENQLVCITVLSKRSVKLNVRVDGKPANFEITQVDYNPALFIMHESAAAA